MLRVSERAQGVKEGTLQIVKDVMKKNSPLMTRLTFEGHGGIANATLYSKRDVKDVGYIPLKASDERLCDVKKYGGFTSVSTAYFFLVEHTVKKKRIRTIETVPVYLKSKLDGNIPALENYCREQLGLSEPSVRVAKIKMQSLLKRDGYEMYLSGKTLGRYVVKNAVSMKLSPTWTEYMRTIDDCCEKDELKEEIIEEKNMELYDILTEKYCASIFEKRPNPVGDKLKAGREKYMLLSLMEQCKVLREIMNLSVIGNTSADLTLIGCAAKTGVMLISNKVSDCKEFKLINQSVTGVYEQVIDLLTV